MDFTLLTAKRMDGRILPSGKDSAPNLAVFLHNPGNLLRAMFRENASAADGFNNKTHGDRDMQRCGSGDYHNQFDY